MQGFYNLPPEIMTRILQSCESFPQVLALSAACKHLNSMWIANSPAIIWGIGSRRIIAFDDALMAVRATAIVLTAHQSGIQPPPFTLMRALSGHSQRPTLGEVKEVLNMQHLVRCVEYMFFNGLVGPWDVFRIGWGEQKTRREPAPDERDEWKDRFYRAMYRLLLAGAVLSGVYMAPFFEAWEDGRKDFLYQCKTKNRSSLHHEFSNEDIERLRRFAVFDVDDADNSEIGRRRNIEYESNFGPFAGWLVEDGRTRGFQKGLVINKENEEWATDAGQLGAVQELMYLLVAYKHLCGNITNADGNEHSGRPIWRYVDQGILPRRRTRTVSVVLFGVFQVEEITMPAQLEDTASLQLPAKQHPSLRNAAAGLFVNRPDITYVVSSIYSLDQSRRPSFSEHGKTSPLPTFQLWEFALRHYLDLGFQKDTLNSGTSCIWYLMIGIGKVFSYPEWNIVEKYKPGRTL